MSCSSPRYILQNQTQFEHEFRVHKGTQIHLVASHEKEQKSDDHLNFWRSTSSHPDLSKFNTASLSQFNGASAF